MRLFKGKSRRTVIFTVISMVSIVVLIALNFILSIVGDRNTLYADMTPEGLYTLSDRMKAECSFIDKLPGDQKVKITFCTDPDYLEGTEILRATYFMALKMSNTFERFEVETVNVTLNPTAVSMYKPTSLSTIKSTDIIVSYGDRYRVVNANNLWNVYNGELAAYNGEYKLATLIKSVTAINQPAAYFLTDHGETYYDPENPASESSLKTAAFADLLADRGLIIKNLKISEVDKIPEDCALIIINNPTEDFKTNPADYGSLTAVSDLEKLDRYLVENQGAVVVARDYARSNLVELDSFLYEWGFDFSDTIVKMPEELQGEGSPALGSGYGTSNLLGVYETDTDSYANAIYGEFAALGSAPKMMISNSGYITSSFGISEEISEAGAEDVHRIFSSFIKSEADAKAYAKDAAGSYLDSSVLADKSGSYTLAGITTRRERDDFTAEYTYSYLFCASSPDFFSNEALGNYHFANYDINAALLNNITRYDSYGSTELGGTSMNLSAENWGGKMLAETTIYEEDRLVHENQQIVASYSGLSKAAKVTYTCIALAVPVSLGLAGIAVFIRRKFL